MINLEVLAWIFRHQPCDAVPEDVVAAVLPALDAPGHGLLVTLREAPLACIRVLLTVFEGRTGSLCLFVRAATVDATNDEALVRAWRYAFTMYGEIEAISSAWNARLMIRRRAKEPRLISVLIPTLSTGVKVSAPWFALALASGDEAVIDALLPHVEAAKHDDGVLDELREAVKFAPKTAAFAVLTERVASLITERARRSALGLAVRERGVQTLEWTMRLELWSNELRLHAPIAWLKADFDTTFAPGRCVAGLEQLHGSSHPMPSAAAEIPRWLARIANERGVTWNWPGRFRGTLKGDERDLFLKWLRSEGA